MSIVPIELKMQQHRHVEFLRELSDAGDRAGVCIEHELLLTDSDPTSPQHPADLFGGVAEVRHFIGEKREFARRFSGNFHDAIIAARSGLEAEEAAGGQKNGVCRSELALVRQQLFIGAARVIGVLMNVDDRLGPDLLCDSHRHGGGGSCKKKFAAGNGRHAGAT